MKYSECEWQGFRPGCEMPLENRDALFTDDDVLLVVYARLLRSFYYDDRGCFRSNKRGIEKFRRAVVAAGDNPINHEAQPCFRCQREASRHYRWFIGLPANRKLNQNP